MSRWTRGLEIATNVAVLLICIALGVLIGVSVLHPRSESSPSKEIKIGQKIDLPGPVGIDKTVVLAISTQCHYCSESMPFYKKLAASVTAKHGHIVAVLPQSQKEAQDYLQSNGVSVDEVFQEQLSKVYVSGTPTLMILDADHKVMSSWVGKLSPDRENQVLSKL
jgi:hypothetical protein